MTDWLNQVHVGNCVPLMRRMAIDGVKVQTIVTSPPYWGLRDYGHKNAFGLEPTLQIWIDHMVYTFDVARDLLADDGTLWLNLGDAYASSGGAGWQGKHGARANRTHTQRALKKNSTVDGLKPKDLMGQPWRVALALQNAGWYLRSDIIWHKPNPMPESTKDRPTKAHEYIFLLSKSERYYYNADAILEPVTGRAHARGSGVNPKANSKVAGWADGPGCHNTVEHAKEAKRAGPKFARNKQNESFSAAVADLVDNRNARTVWLIPTEAFSASHFATFPRELPRRCILAGTRGGGYRV